MTTDAVFTRPTHAEPISRQIALRTRGHSHGRNTRLPGAKARASKLTSSSQLKERSHE